MMCFRGQGGGIADVDFVACHQPNVKLLQIGARKIGIPFERIALVADRVGNLGPASVLVSLVSALDGGIPRGSRVLVAAFGLGFSCGAAALAF